jgi:hypothetical protein
LKIDNMALGLSVSGFDFEATPVRVTFKGQNGFDIGANATIVSDPIPLAYVDSAEKALLLSYHIPSDAGAKSNMRINSSQTGWTRSYKGDVDETFTLTATGYTTSGGSVVIGVSKVEFGDAP